MLKFIRAEHLTTLNCRVWHWFALCVAMLALLLPMRVAAHAFGQRYDLPLPMSLYLWSAAAAVVLSFVIAAMFLRIPSDGGRGWSRELGDLRVVRWLQSATFCKLFKLLSVLLYLLILATGLFGSTNPSNNFAPIFVWIIWWVGMAYIVALLGNVWDLLNPWRVIYETLQFWVKALRTPLLRYPERLGAWPALLLFFLFAYLEFISGIAEQPRTLAWLIIAYSLITFSSMFVFGAETWLRNGEAFTVLFDLIARFGLFRGDTNKSTDPRAALRLRLPASGLRAEKPVSVSIMAFTILMLTTVSFDGFVETPFWQTLSVWALNGLSGGETLSVQQSAKLQKLVMTVALLLFYGLFLVVFIAFSAAVARLSGPRERTLETACAYVLTLVPIAIAYHLAHYLSFLLLAGQLIIPIVSDPFALGWNLFGTRDYRIDITVIGARQVWYLSIAAIVVGHILSVCLAHATALRRLESTKTAVFSQLPMLVLMVSYTMISLWILSQPIIAD